MKIKKIKIKNFKSILDLTIEEPSPFTVFVGPNASGKSNIFEALEYVSFFTMFYAEKANRFFGGPEKFLNFTSQTISSDIIFEYSTQIIGSKDREYSAVLTHHFSKNNNNELSLVDHKSAGLRFNKSIFFDKEYFEDYNQKIHKQIYRNFSKLFIGRSDNKINFSDDQRLLANGGNLEKVLKRILSEERKREDILEWLALFVPELEKIYIYSDNISGQDTLLIKEKYTEKPFNKSLISNGTYNILCLLTAVYQSDEPQFLCIEEPENGLNPYVVKELVNFFRTQCEENKHYIWLNTHSQTLVSELKPEELIVVDKKEGATQIRQFRNKNMYGLRMDEAWLSNVLGGGIPW